MSTVSFQKTDGPASLAPEVATAEVVASVPASAIPVNTSTAVAVAQPSAPPAVATPNAFNDDENIDPRDLSLPRLNIVQKVGDLSNIFTPGDLVLDGSLVLADSGKELGKKSGNIRVVVIGFQATKFVEKVEGGGQGRTIATEKELVAANGTLDFNEAKATGKSWYQRSTTALVLIEQPANDKSNYFGTVIEGKKYALALWTLKGTGYTNGARPIMTKRKIGELRGAVGYRGGVFNVASKLQKYGTNFAFTPVVDLTELTSDTFKTELAALGL